jgi:uncharacterized protein (DUF3820 family)
LLNHVVDLAERVEQLETIVNSGTFTPPAELYGAAYEDICAFKWPMGKKYKNKRMDQIPEDYLRWAQEWMLNTDPERFESLMDKVDRYLRPGEYYE